MTKNYGGCPGQERLTKPAWNLRDDEFIFRTPRLLSPGAREKKRGVSRGNIYCYFFELRIHRDSVVCEAGGL